MKFSQILTGLVAAQVISAASIPESNALNVLEERRVVPPSEIVSPDHTLERRKEAAVAALQDVHHPPPTLVAYPPLDQVDRALSAVDNTMAAVLEHPTPLVRERPRDSSPLL